jgi:hypothetical protein
MQRTAFIWMLRICQEHGLVGKAFVGVIWLAVGCSHDQARSSGWARYLEMSNAQCVVASEMTPVLAAVDATSEIIIAKLGAIATAGVPSSVSTSAPGLPGADARATLGLPVGEEQSPVRHFYRFSKQ